MGDLFSAEEFYRGFRNACINPDARTEWSGYRRQVTDFILANSEPGTTVAIYGAGRCDDLELEKMTSHFSKIVLADCMYENQTTGVEPSKYKENIDLTGIPRDSFLLFIDYFQKNLGCLGQREGEEAFREDLFEIIQEAYEKRVDVNGLSGAGRERLKTDYSVILGVHSQLNNSFSGIWNYVLAALAPYRNTRGELYDSCCRLMTDIEMEQRKHTPEIVHSVNDFVISNTGRAFFAGYELYLKEQMAVAATEGAAAVEGAWQCSHDLEEREKAGHIRNTAFIRPEWPLDSRRGINYAMAVGVWDIKL